MEPFDAGAPNVHGRPFSDRFKPFEDLDAFGRIFFFFHGTYLIDKRRDIGNEFSLGRSAFLPSKLYRKRAEK
jgi:hypothetical protein